MRKTVILATLAVLAIGATAAWKIQHDVAEEQEGMLARAAVSPEAARSIALASVRGGRITEAELEEENGRLQYAFDIVLDGNTYDVEVDATTGELLQSVIEDDDDDDEEDDDDRRR